LAKNFSLSDPVETAIELGHPTPPEGRMRNRHETRGGMRFESFRLAAQPTAKSGNAKGDRMKDEYVLSKAERGKFFREGARLVPPLYLEPDVLDYLAEFAGERAAQIEH
jgi:hypothetical protein